MMDAIAARAAVALVFGRLFENEFATLDGIAISCRSTDGLIYADGTTALALWLDDRSYGPASAPRDPTAHALHREVHAALPEHDTVISGWSRHLRALLLEGLGMPPATSMLRRRGVSDLAAHHVERAALSEGALPETTARARAAAAAAGMRHVLIVSDDGLVVVSGGPPSEAMAHWQNVEFAARVECLRLEELAAEGLASEPRIR